MSPETIRERLLADGVHNVYERIFITMRPSIFSKADEFADWQASLANSAKLQPQNIKLVGSAHVGFSLAPDKFGRSFSRVATSERPASDLDVALINERLFLSGWNALLERDRRQALRLTHDERSKLRQDVYYGFLSHKLLPRGTDVSRKILAVRTAAGQHAISSGLRTNIRLYRRDEDFFGYQISSLRQLRTSLHT